MKYLLILLVVCLAGCFNTNNMTAAAKAFCKGCKGTISAELVMSTYYRSMILKCNDFEKVQ